MTPPSQLWVLSRAAATAVTVRISTLPAGSPPARPALPARTPRRKAAGSGCPGPAWPS